jgi:HlyD family secretion protein
MSTTLASESPPPAGSTLVIPADLTTGSRRRQRVLWAGAALLVAAAAIVWAFVVRASVVVYRTEPVSRRTIVHVVEAMGHLDVPARVEIPAPGPGWLSRILVEPGEAVHRGQLLAQLDQTSATLAVGSARDSVQVSDGRLAEARAALESARDVAARTERLATRGLASEADRQAAKAAEARARGTLAAAGAEREVALHALSTVELQRRLTAVLAPLDGVVLVAPDRVGATVAPEAGRLFVLGSTTATMHIEVSVAEADIADVHPGQAAAFTVPAFASRSFEAHVLHVDPDAQRERSSVAYRVTLAADNSQHLLFPGMTATVRIDVARAEQVLAVREAALRFAPRLAPTETDRSVRIWRLDANGRIARVGVEPGVSDGAYTEVRVRPGDELHLGDLAVIGLVSPDERPAHGPGVALGRR